jgi:hypothetical protein
MPLTDSPSNDLHAGFIGVQCAMENLIFHADRGIHLAAKYITHSDAVKQ